MHELIIIGGGPAGIVAGVYAARKNLKTLLLTKDFIGQTGNAGVIENWPGEEKILGPELMNKFTSHLESYDTKIKEEEVTEIIKEENYFKIITEDNSYKSKAVIVATGRKPRPLKIPGEEKFTGKGVSYCVTCDGALFKDKQVVVVGGGNAGLEGALELADYTKKVKVLEIASALQADEYLIKKVETQKNIEVITEAEPIRIKGDDFASGLVYKKNKKEEEIKAEGIFIEIGSIPTANFLGDLVDFNKQKEIKINRDCTTKTKGLFAAGDVTNVRDKQIVVATGEGCKALLSAYDYIKN